MISLSKIVCIILLTGSLSGCIWGTAAIVGVAVVGANVDEYQESGKQRNATEALDEHLAEREKIDAALRESSKNQDESIDSEEVIETYSGRILTD